MRRYDYVVIGGGSAGRKAVETLREEAPDAALLLADAEPVLPYKRTGVSKNVAAGILENQFAIHDEMWYRSRKIDLMTGSGAQELEPEAACITIDGERIGYRGLLLALGARPRLPFSDPPGEGWSFLWTERQGRIVHRMSAGRKLAAVVGMGVLGVEAAWQLRQMGAEVSVFGGSDRPMERYLDPVTAEMLTEKLRAEGIALFFDREVSGLTVSGGRSGVTVKTDAGDGPADFVVVAAGSEPEVSLAKSAGLRVNRGIAVDSALRTSHAHIWAAGDCAEHPDGRITGIWHAAENQGQLAALSMLGRPVVNDNPPFRLKCEVFGGFWFSAGYDGPFEDAELWRFGENLWRPRFVEGRLVSLTGAAPGGVEKRDAKAAQALVLRGAARENVEATLRSFG